MSTPSVPSQGSASQRAYDFAKWAILSIPLAPVAPPARFKRIDLKIDRVWQPALYVAGSADMRLVGMQVGEPRLIRE